MWKVDAMDIDGRVVEQREFATYHKAHRYAMTRSWSAEIYRVNWRVDVHEYGAGFGIRLEWTRTFDDFESALAYQIEFNSVNDEPVISSWYMSASDPYQE